MEKKKIAVLIGSLQADAASLLALLRFYVTIAIKISQEQRKLHYLKLDILNLNFTSQISLYLSYFHCNKFKHTPLDKRQIHCLTTYLYTRYSKSPNYNKSC